MLCLSQCDKDIERITKRTTMDTQDFRSTGRPHNSPISQLNACRNLFHRHQIIAMVILLLVVVIVALAIRPSCDCSGRARFDKELKLMRCQGSESSQANRCMATKEKPIMFELSRPIARVSTDNKVLVSAYGFVELYDLHGREDEVGYLPMWLIENVTMSGAQTMAPNEQGFNLTLVYECFKIKFDLRKVEDNENNKTSGDPKIRIVQFEYESRYDPINGEAQPGTNVGSLGERQLVNQTISVRKRLSCLGRHYLTLFGNKQFGGRGQRYRKPLLELIFQNFELEFFGDPQRYELGHFTKEPEDLDCNKGDSRLTAR